MEVGPQQQRICLVAPEFLGPFQNGGVGTACYWQALTLARAGLPVTVLYTGATERESPAHWTRVFRDLGGFSYVDLWQWAHSSRAAQRWATRSTAHHDERAAQLVLEYLREHHFDVVLFQEFLGHGARALQARETGLALEGTRCVVTLHSSRRWIYEGSAQVPLTREDVVVDFLERESTRLADRVVAPSSYMAKWAIERWRIARHIDVVPNCYDSGLAGSDQTVVHRGPFRHLVFFGRLETRKGLHVFLRALASSRRLRQHVECVTFLGRHARVEHRPSEEFITEALAGMPWLRANVHSDWDSHEALAWLSQQPDTLVVTPSLADNLPYAVVELHARRIPFVSTDVGGIPEIVGPLNRHQLATPDVDAIRDVLERVTSDGLTIDYRDGYQAERANGQQVKFVRDLLTTTSGGGVRATADRLTVVVTDATCEADLETVRQTSADGSSPTTFVRWCTLRDWQRIRGVEPALFVLRSVSLGTESRAALLRAIAHGNVHVATSFALVQGGRLVSEVESPLGASTEMGWRTNCFGGPCFIARADAFAVLDSVIRNGFTFWAAYAAITCRGLRLGMIPEPLYDVARSAASSTEALEAEQVLRHYTDARTGAVDLGWAFKTVRALGAGDMVPDEPTGRGVVRAASAARAVYERLVATSDEELCSLAREEATPDAFWRDLAAIRVRLAPLLDEWSLRPARVFIYGAGVHTRLLLAAFPDLGRFVRGFIDRRPLGRFLERPSILADQFRPDMADVIVYSSREFERDMYAAMAHHAVAHVLLYSSPRTLFTSKAAVTAFAEARPA